MLNRRNFLRSLPVIGSTFYLDLPPQASIEIPEDRPIACQQYPWQTFLQREGKEWKTNVATAMEQVSGAGFSGFEPTIDSIIDIGKIQPFLSKHDLQTHSVYVNSVLHEPEEWEENAAAIVRLAKMAKALGVQIIVTNPAPIRWGGDEDKTDEQLTVQANALDELGRQLKEIDITLAYHNHDIEMRQGAREFHHMMLGTDPDHVKLCLDAHWIYRGAGNSQVALFDIVRLYQDRIAELHLRQSEAGTWTEAFGPGDIDYEKLAGMLREKGQQPHLVLEQAVEKGTPHTMSALEAHQKGVEYVKQVFEIS